MNKIAKLPTKRCNPGEKDKEKGCFFSLLPLLSRESVKATLYQKEKEARKLSLFLSREKVANRSGGFVLDSLLLPPSDRA
jgi:hypothetical protein